MPVGVKGSTRFLTKKTCTHCKEEKPINEFYVKRKDTDGVVKAYEPTCKNCSRIKANKNYSKNKDSYSKSSLSRYHTTKNHDTRESRGEYKLMVQYSMTWEIYDEMYKEQNGCCKICSTQYLSRGRNRLVIDHDHETNLVRSLLCNKCNLALGLLQDNAENILNAYNYLKKGD